MDELLKKIHNCVERSHYVVSRLEQDALSAEKCMAGDLLDEYRKLIAAELEKAKETEKDLQQIEEFIAALLR